MKEMPVIRFESEEAKRLADIASIYQDLAFVIKTTNRLENIIIEKNEDDILIRSLWTAALIAFIRCFTSGKRYGLNEEIFSEVSGGLETYKYFKDVRDKHIAHSVNPFEETQVGIVLSENFDVVGISTLTSFRMTDDLHNINMLGNLAKFAQQKIAPNGKELEKNILAQAKKISKDELAKFPKMRIQPQGGSEIAKKPRAD